ncbi:MAG: hypothetical protein KDL87_15225, partial [Verrucomicrobiae bacterium]|nr:hypothetical protein [Verrucomicrobiae bacterium]
RRREASDEVGRLRDGDVFMGKREGPGEVDSREKTPGSVRRENWGGGKDLGGAVSGRKRSIGRPTGRRRQWACE